MRCKMLPLLARVSAVRSAAWLSRRIAAYGHELRRFSLGDWGSWVQIPPPRPALSLCLFPRKMVLGNIWETNNGSSRGLHTCVRMLLRSSRGRPLNAPAAFIHPCQPIVERDCFDETYWARVHTRYIGERCLG